jgi:hypothetical protein
VKRAGGAVGRELHARVADLLGQPGDVANHVGAGPGKADIGGIDLEPLHQVEDVELVLDRGASDRGRLETVAEGFVIELDAKRRSFPALAGLVPVVDQILFVHGRGLGIEWTGRKL